MAMTTAVARRPVQSNPTLVLITTRAIAGRTLPKMNCTPANNLGGVQQKNGNGENLSGGSHDASRCKVFAVSKLEQILKLRIMATTNGIVNRFELHFRSKSRLRSMAFASITVGKFVVLGLVRGRNLITIDLH